MPLYEYKCNSCGEVFELIQKFSDAPLTVHEKCGGAVERLISPSAFQFKGSGWYVTDYGKGGHKPAAPKSESGDTGSKSEKSNGTESSSKPEKSAKSTKTESSSSTTSTSKSDK